MFTSKQLKQISKYLSLILRHKPESIGLSLDKNGWANIDELISKSSQYSDCISLDFELIQKVVNTSDKQRFIISDEKKRIRANQGHSIKVDLQLKPAIPPALLYHGTATRFLDSILKEGLTPQKRHHVHLSTKLDTARSVAQRYGTPIILQINSQLMSENGFEFYLSENGIWLTDSVPPEFLILN